MKKGIKKFIMYLILFVAILLISFIWSGNVKATNGFQSETIEIKSPDNYSNFLYGETVKLSYLVGDGYGSYYYPDITGFVYLEVFRNDVQIKNIIMGLVEDGSYSVCNGLPLNDFVTLSGGFYQVNIVQYPYNVKTGKIESTSKIPTSKYPMKTVYFGVHEEKTPTMSFASSSLTKTYGASTFTNKLTTNSTGTVTYKSSNTSVATVDTSGKVTIKASGTATITATTARTWIYAPSSKSYTLKVNKATPTLKFANSSVTKEVGASTFTNTLTKTTNGSITYSSSNTSVATVNSSGVVTVKGIGTTTIKVTSASTSQYNSGSASYTLTVKKNPTMNFASSSLTKNLGNGKSETFTNKLTTNTDGKVTYKSSNTNIATIDSSGKVTIKGTGTTTITATATETSTYKGISKTYKITVQLPFTDVKTSDYYYNTVSYSYGKGYIKGTSPTKFTPSANITRADFVVILYNMEGAPKVTSAKSFPDVNSSDYYYNAIRWATSKGIVNGYSNGKYGPKDNITREQLAVILRNYAKYKEKNSAKTTSIAKYKDSSKISEYAKTSVQWAVATGVISGKNNGTKIDPQGKATRAEAVTMIYNFCTMVK